MGLVDVRRIDLSEEQLARPIVAWLRERHWEVYQEVAFRGRCADIVATLGPRVWVIEVKKTLGLDVITQAVRWIGSAHFVSVAAPSVIGAYGSHRDFIRKILDWQGIGLLEVRCHRQRPSDLAPIDVDESVQPPIHRRAAAGVLRCALDEKQKTFAPAGNGSRHWSPFKRTCETVLCRVRYQPGITMKELLDIETTHYRSKSSAASSLAIWIENGKVPGVRLEREGGRLRLFPDEAKP